LTEGAVIGEQGAKAQRADEARASGGWRRGRGNGGTGRSRGSVEGGVRGSISDRAEEGVLAADARDVVHVAGDFEGKQVARAVLDAQHAGGGAVAKLTVDPEFAGKQFAGLGLRGIQGNLLLKGAEQGIEGIEDGPGGAGAGVGSGVGEAEDEFVEGVGVFVGDGLKGEATMFPKGGDGSLQAGKTSVLARA
jgi:hypothetical protein